MTSSAGTRGSIRAGSPPMAAIASRMAARSTTAGTPVKSCMSTRAGVKAISRLGSARAPQVAIDGKALRRLGESFQGQLVDSADPDYDEHRNVWNGSIDRRPALVARC